MKIVRQYQAETDPQAAQAGIVKDLFGYSSMLDAWAEKTSGIMIRRAADADLAVWRRVGERMSRETKRILKSAGAGDVFRELQNEQVTLIKSLPLQAAKTVHDWAQKALTEGTRPESFFERISTDLKPMTESHARLIARTETARARSNFTEARARAVGSERYIWRTVGDSSVRKMHAKLNDTVQRWDSPPVCDIGRGGAPLRSHPGCIFNCRCFAIPLFDDEDDGKKTNTSGRNPLQRRRVLRR